MDMNVSKLQEMVKDREPWRAAVPGAANSWTRLSDCTHTLSPWIVITVHLSDDPSREDDRALAWLPSPRRSL